MWKRGITIGAVVAALLLLAGVAIAAGSGSGQTDTTDGTDTTVASVPRA